MSTEIKYNLKKFKKEDFQTTKGFVAVYDILGYGVRIKENDLFKMVAIQENMQKMVQTNTEGIVNNGYTDSERIEMYFYADTIILYSKEQSDSAFAGLLKASSFVFLAAIAYEEFPIRGATACGEFYVSNNLITGKPIIDAHRYEQQQEWIGCWITDECFKQLSKNAQEKYLEDKTIIKYFIPLKEGGVKSRYAYNWVSPTFYGMVDKNFLTKKSFLQKRKFPNWPDEMKRRNTVNFINHVLKITSIKT